MKHIKKLIEITVTLRTLTGWSAEEIHKFINNILSLQYRLQTLNEEQASDFTKDIERLRNTLISDIMDYMDNAGISIPARSIRCSRRPDIAPILFDFGKQYANYKDNKSFVIDL